MRVLGASFAKKSETIDSIPEFLAEVLRRNPQDETPHVTLMEGERPSLGVFAAIVATELTSKRFSTLSQVAREYGCSQMKLIDAFKALQDSDLLEFTETEGKQPRPFVKSKPSALLASVLRAQGFRLGAVEQMDAELFGKALAEFDTQIKKSLGVVIDADRLDDAADKALATELDDDSFAALCTVLAQRSKNVPVVGLGRGIEVSPAAFILLHEINKSEMRLKDIPAVSQAYDIPAPTLYSAFDRLVSAGLLQDSKDAEAGAPAFASCELSENARRTLSGRCVATSLGIVLFSTELGMPVVSQETYSLLELTHAGLSLNSSVASESLRTSRGSASRYLANMEQAGLLVLRSGSTYDATPLAKRVLSEKSFAAIDSAQWRSDPAAGKSLQAILDAANSARSRLSLHAKTEIASSAIKAKQSAKLEEIDAALDRAIKNDVQRISNHLINLASKRNRQVFYSSELGFMPGKMSEDRKSDLSIRREAVRYLFSAGFLSFDEDFSDALANGVKPTNYQPPVKLHPLGDHPNSTFVLFDRSRDDYSLFRQTSYLRSISRSTISIDSLCEKNGFEPEDLKDFLNEESNQRLAISTWALNQNTGALEPGVILSSDILLDRKVFSSPSLDFLSLNTPCSGKILLQALLMSSTEPSLTRETLRILEKNGVISKFFDENKYESTRYLLVNASEDVLQQRIKKTRRDLKDFHVGTKAPLHMLAALSQKGVVRVKDVLSGEVGFNLDSKEKPTEKELDLLESTGALRRYRSKTGALDYFLPPNHLEGKSLEEITRHVERSLSGLEGKKTPKKNMRFPEFLGYLRDRQITTTIVDRNAFLHGVVAYKLGISSREIDRLCPLPESIEASIKAWVRTYDYETELPAAADIVREKLEDSPAQLKRPNFSPTKDVM